MSHASTRTAETFQSKLVVGDNRTLQTLLGPGDANLKRIRAEYQVEVSCRGNLLSILGAAADVSRAQSTLERSMKHIGRHGTLDAAELSAVIQMHAVPDAGPSAGVGIVTKSRPGGIMPRGPGQVRYVELLKNKEMVFGIGPAGTGKTYLAVAHGCLMLQAGAVDRIILSRPAVEAGERLGFLPGDLKEKVDPYLRPLYDALHDMMPGDQVVRRMGTGEIEVAPLAFMRGRTLGRAFVILDEAQNTTPVQMKMFLSRMGEGSRMVITGDLSQIDLPGHQKSGLADALDTVEGLDGIGVCQFQNADIVRHPLVGRIIDAYDRKNAAKTG